MEYPVSLETAALERAAFAPVACGQGIAGIVGPLLRKAPAARHARLPDGERVEVSADTQLRGAIS
jgi:hypothetical protein